MLQRLGAVRAAPQRHLPSLLGPERPITHGPPSHAPASPPVLPKANKLTLWVAKQCPGWKYVDSPEAAQSVVKNINTFLEKLSRACRIAILATI